MQFQWLVQDSLSAGGENGPSSPAGDKEVEVKGEATSSVMQKGRKEATVSFSHVDTEVFKAERDTGAEREEFIGGSRTGTEDVDRLGNGYLVGKL